MIVIPHNVQLCKQFLARMSIFNQKIGQLIFSNCFHGKRPLWELKLVKRGKTSIFIVNKRLREVKVEFLIEHDKRNSNTALLH